ncbi:hypothetical protein POX_b03002 [Penicillium oxalicum]|uniref:Uncharacterized protein n=1 Tax=Penicillium oxalicum (strain 114-2 / CGMCC 5302) TaxID=933388 RepID=S7ZH32_PENO1|nr:hypothetical protein POX_b03002 [Penicillium oxalicum]EPS29980.1 hypothetical protein PDE_04930 [Penicillium oxalicum 114-2]KAI2792958.1 hypothetical protein POX_b03002 [Penicillium oxalicum]
MPSDHGGLFVCRVERRTIVRLYQFDHNQRVANVQRSLKYDDTGPLRTNTSSLILDGPRRGPAAKETGPSPRAAVPGASREDVSRRVWAKIIRNQVRSWTLPRQFESIDLDKVEPGVSFCVCKGLQLVPS